MTRRLTDADASQRFRRLYPSFRAVHWWLMWSSAWRAIGLEHAHRSGVLDDAGRPWAGYRFSYWQCTKCGLPCVRGPVRCGCRPLADDGGLP